MMKYGVLSLFVAMASLIGQATAQSSQGRSYSASGNSSRDPLQTATKPLTPKSAMPAHRTSTVAAPGNAARGRNTTAELNRLERQNVKTKSPKSNSTAPANAAPLAKSGNASDSGGSKINFTYQKPVAGLQAATPKANSANSATPRVQKN